jgi:acyl-coenzyme A synthetase/AMP-(fatty) acid ligase/thioesterase domain-containing protein
LIAFLAILKTGRVTVFLDPHLPAERLRDICELAGITSCVVDAANVETSTTLPRIASVVNIDGVLADLRTHPSNRSSLPALTTRGGTDAASIVFTSGSTGRPKGVIQTHGQLLNDTYGFGDRFGLTPDDRVALVLPYGFAAGLTLLFGALLQGASVWSFDPRHGGARGLISWINDQRLTTLHCTPHLLRSVVGAMSHEMTLPSLRLVSTVGEAVSGRDIEAIRAHLSPEASFFNWSGSSEIGTLAIHEIAGDAAVPEGTIPAGRPFVNKDVLLLREDGTSASTGEVGEIVAVSHFLSGGYWNNDAANAERFQLTDDGRRLCRQGDLGRFDDNGDLLLLGRADAAIKVRGYLVEPSEIEAAFMSTNGIAEVAVIPVVDPPAPTRLIAYVVPVAGLRPQSPAALRRSLREKLPEYMVPASIVQLTELPRNERGKVDRPRLPAVEVASASSEPMSPWEIVIADIWGVVLGLTSVGLDDDFMALGGDSLSAEELFTIVQERFGVVLLSTDLIEAPTLREFTRRIKLGSGALPSHPDMFTLQPSGTQTPVFCFAGSGALALTFSPLARHFPDRGVYAFQAHGLERRAIPDWSVEAAATRFLQLLRIVQPRGPYILLGHSYGGLIALEVAHRLRAAGEQVELVGLLDTYLPTNFASQPALSFETMPDRPHKPTVIRRAQERVTKQIERVLPDGLPALSLVTKRVRGHLAGMVPWSGQHQFDAFFDHGTITSRRYVMKPYDGRVAIVLAENNPDGPHSWQPLLTGRREFFEIRSEHTSLLREPHAREVAEMIRAEMSAVELERA